VHKLENALCSQDKFLFRVFCENKDLNLKLENSFVEIVSFQSMHNHMSAKPCENCNMIMVNYADLWIVHAQLASQLKGAKLELKEFKARSSLLAACTSYPMLKSNLEASSIEIKELKQRLDHSSRYKVFSPPCEVCGSLKGKLLHATKENSEVKQEVVYLSARLERTKLSEKMIENDLSWVEESATKCTYNLGVGFERCEDKSEKSAPKFVPSSNYDKEEETLKPTTHPIPSHHSTPREVWNKILQSQVRKFTFSCFVAMRVTWMSIAFVTREWRRCVWTMLETHIMMSLLIFHLTFHLVLHLIFLMDLTIAHMILIHERVVLCLDALMLTHALIVVFVPRVGMVFLLEVSILTLSWVALTVHAFPVMVHVLLAQMVRCKGLWRLPWVVWLSARFLRFFLTNSSTEPSTFSHSM
jgi:hypothetical protein